MQPTDGYPMIDDHEVLGDILKSKGLDTVDFRKGEVIADIGAGNGYLEAIFSVYTDSLTFYIQDIDTAVCNQRTVDEVFAFYEEVRGSPFTNSYFVVNGTDTKTNLPYDTFDRIMMLWTYQYLTEPEAFILDVRKTLKEGGLLYCINPDVDYDPESPQTKEYGWNQSPVEMQITDIIDCGFELIRITRNYESGQRPYVILFKKSTGKGNGINRAERR